ncbi:phosphotransferase [Kaistia soli]|uniref:phosphotransferase enzyme family protein n=1 Tax=Kaistia soli TaxID=446684 RepID=UPI0009330D7F
MELEGGRAGRIWRDGDSVTRPAGAWTPTVHRFLRHLHDAGFSAAPMPLALEGGQEIVTYVEGRVCEDLADPATGSLAMLASAGALLRRFHDAARGFLESDGEEQRWMLPPQEPCEIVCHGDFAPFNVATVGEAAVGIIDFDASHPAPAVWDLAYAVYRWAPLSDPTHDGVAFGTEEQLRRARLFCDAYGADENDRRQLPDMIVRRLRALLDFMHARANAGDATFVEDINVGDSDIYIRDLDYIRQRSDRLISVLID